MANLFLQQFFQEILPLSRPVEGETDEETSCSTEGSLSLATQVELVLVEDQARTPPNCHQMSPKPKTKPTLAGSRGACQKKQKKRTKARRISDSFNPNRWENSQIPVSFVLATTTATMAVT
jgi:hypothetical protein